MVVGVLESLEFVSSLYPLPHLYLCIMSWACVPKVEGGPLRLHVQILMYLNLCFTFCRLSSESYCVSQICHCILCCNLWNQSYINREYLPSCVSFLEKIRVLHTCIGLLGTQGAPC